MAAQVKQIFNLALSKFHINSKANSNITNLTSITMISS